MRAALRSAYASTRYEAAGIVVRIGRRSAAMDALLRANGVRSAGFITAWNPFSRKMPRGWNERMQARLREAMRGRVIAQGWGRAEGWAEQHLLVAGDTGAIAALARRFRQNAVVIVARDRPARLVAARDQRSEAFASSNIRFAFSTS
ncbi:MAG TPA: DUF3293 domain-containing protein [Falsiroseomonas sp.]|jgi:hypothetical protein|nr:DUF3293 domain-containing protein [Falsiroseomonas sp.]